MARDHFEGTLRELAQTATPPRRVRRNWSFQEVESLKAGIRKYGLGKWSEMLRDPEFTFIDRTNVDLKDKYRNLMGKTLSSTRTSRVLFSSPSSSDPVQGPIEVFRIDDVMKTSDNIKIVKIRAKQKLPKPWITMESCRQLPNFDELMDDYKGRLREKLEAIDKAAVAEDSSEEASPEESSDHEFSSSSGSEPDMPHRSPEKLPTLAESLKKIVSKGQAARAARQKIRSERAARPRGGRKAPLSKRLKKYLNNSDESEESESKTLRKTPVTSPITEPPKSHHQRTRNNSSPLREPTSPLKRVLDSVSKSQSAKEASPLKVRKRVVEEDDEEEEEFMTQVVINSPPKKATTSPSKVPSKPRVRPRRLPLSVKPESAVASDVTTEASATSPDEKFKRKARRSGGINFDQTSPPKEPLKIKPNLPLNSPVKTASPAKRSQKSPKKVLKIAGMLAESRGKEKNDGSNCIIS